MNVNNILGKIKNMFKGKPKVVMTPNAKPEPLPRKVIGNTTESDNYRHKANARHAKRKAVRKWKRAQRRING